MTIHHILVDFENVPIASLAKLEGRDDIRITIFLGKNNNKVGTDLVMAMQKLENRAQFVRLHSTGPNALDFFIAWYLGKIISTEATTRCTVISKDKGFDALIAHLVGQGKQVARHPSIDAIPDFKDAPAAKKPRATSAKAATKPVAPKPAPPKSAVKAAPPIPETKPAPSRTQPKGRRARTTTSTQADANFDVVLAMLGTRAKALPAKRKTLLGTIVGRLGKDVPAEEAERICQKLIDLGYVSETQNKLTYQLRS